MNGPEQIEPREQTEQTTNSGEQMTEFEQALARSMRRVEVRPETTAKLLAVAEDAERQHVHAGGGLRLLKLSNGGRVFAMPQPRAWTRTWMGGAIAAVLAMGCFVGAHVHEQHERRVEAQKQFDTAERITDQALARTREELAQQGIYLDRQ